jgi:hypothetical protein
MWRLFLRPTSLGLLFAACISCSDSCDSNLNSPSIAKRLNQNSDLILGPNAESRLADYVLDNGAVRFAFQRPGSATGWGVYGGSLVDIDSYSPTEKTAFNDDRFQELFGHCNLRAFKAKSASILSPGNDEEPGVIQFVGTDGGFPLLDSILPSSPLNVEITMEFSLMPGSETLQITQRAKDLAKTEPRDIYCGLILIKGDSNHGFADNYGRDIQDVTGEISYAAGASDGRSSFVLTRKEGLFDTLALQSEVMILSSETEPLLANDTRVEHYTLSIGRTGDIESALAAMRTHRGSTELRREVQLNLVSSVPLEYVRDHVTLLVEELVSGMPPTKQSRTEARIAADGNASVSLTDGSYEVGLLLDGQLVSSTIIEVSGPVTQKMELQGLGLVRSVAKAKFLKWGVLDSPVKLNFLSGHDASLSSRGPIRRYVKASDSFVLPVGNYTMVASKGPEFELDVQNITVKEGEELAVKTTVEQVVDSSGWASGDYHVHGARSMDSDASREIRVIAAIAEGLDILVSTDHDVTTDYGPYATALGVEDLIHTVPGLEASPLYGHMNAYPMPVQDKEPYWNIRWWEYDENDKFTGVLTPAELVDEIRLQNAQVISANHPRGSQALFEYLRLDDHGVVQGTWPDFDAFEIMNDTNASEIPQLLNDWMALFGVNRRLTALGVSDSHGEFGLGYSRTYVRVDNDDPAQIDESQLWPNLKGGQAVATTGPFVVMHADKAGKDAQIGDTLVNAGALNFDVEVHAPSWMAMDQLRLMENGVELSRVTIPDSDSGGLRLQHTFTATPSKDSLYFLIVDGTPGERHPLVIDGEARAITNPIFVDVDGNGFSYVP